MSTRPVTIRDIAEAARVSIAKVSYVLNDTRKVTDDVRRRVQNESGSRAEPMRR